MSHRDWAQVCWQSFSPRQQLQSGNGVAFLRPPFDVQPQGNETVKTDPSKLLGIILDNPSPAPKQVPIL